MARAKEQFKILLCGKKEMMTSIRGLIVQSEAVHLQFASSPAFLAGRALFSPPHLVLLDARPDTLQMKNALREFSTQYTDVPVIAIVAEADHTAAVELVKLGVSSYFEFPEDRRRISEEITKLQSIWIGKKNKERFVESQREVYDFHNIIGSSTLLQETLDRAQKVIKNNAMTVLITGETGTGKELVARAIHYNSKNRNSPFVDIACSALPDTLLESELFGYEKGAFTDAKDRKIGLFELAGDGSIFLDEIGDISLATQSKLLKVIEDRTMRRLGGVRDIPVKARIIAATSADLDAKMESGQFRRDLYHRLKILPLELPPLRERKDDIPGLVGAFLGSFDNAYGKKIKGVTHHAMQLLMEHDWEGNVRELKHAIERAVLLEEGEWITEEDFELGARKKRPTKRKVIGNKPESLPAKEVDTLMLLVPFDRASLDEVQLMYAQKVLEHLGGNKARAAQKLKISRPRLDRILRANGRDGQEE